MRSPPALARRAPALLLLGLGLLGAGCADPLDGVERRYATTCRLSGALTPPPRLKLTPVLPNLDVQLPVQMLVAPGGAGRIFTVSVNGYVMVSAGLDDQGPGVEWFRVPDPDFEWGGEKGLLSIAFDPGFQQNGRFYVNYTRRRGAQLQTVISRFLVPAPPLGLPDSQSEAVLLTIDQPYDNHNGGQLQFGPDGALYIGMGDGGAGGDPLGAGQDRGSLLGKVLRIDVSAGDGSYRVPADNPFVGRADTRPEIWALGLRNPWRFSFDPAEGTLWAGDVGQDLWEEVNIIQRGGNYGWSVQEGSACYNPMEGCDPTGLIAPVAVYSHDEGKSITGGVVYRGQRIPGLHGTYVFGDFATGTVWGLHPGQDGAWTRTTLIESAGHPSAFGVDDEGELYLVDLLGNRLLRLEAADPAAPGAPGWPQALSQTGCFADLPRRTLVDGALRYAVNAPLWADGADKERALVLPPDGTLGYREAGAWELPSGTVLIKTFALAERPLETRFLVRDGASWRGATYRWNAAGTDAQLLSGAVRAEVAGRTWYFPSRADCAVCHTSAAGHVLGLATAQLNRAHDLFGTGAVEQLDALARLGYLSGAPPRPPSELPRRPDPLDAAAPVAQRARAYLDANCSHCHRPGGLAVSTSDLRYDTTLADTKVCDAPPLQGDLGVAAARLVAPGAPERSVLYLRMASADPKLRMPNLATALPDPAGVELIRQWILHLGSCSQEAPPR